MLILSSAPLLAATVYMTLGRLIRSLEAEEHAILSTRWVTKIYVLIDIGSLVCQVMGSAMQANGDANSVQTGMRVVMIGLGVQLFALACFVLMTAVVHHRLIDAPTFISNDPRLRWRRALPGFVRCERAHLHPQHVQIDRICGRESEYCVEEGGVPLHF